MDDKNDVKIKLIDEDGNAVDKTILFTFRCEELDKDYLVFDAGEVDSEGNNVLGATAYNPGSSVVNIEPITDPDELEMINDAVREVLESQGE